MIVSDGSIISKAEIIRSVIGIRSVINEGSKLDHVVMMGADSFETLEEIEEAKAAGIPPMGIGKNCKVVYEVIYAKDIYRPVYGVYKKAKYR